MLLNGASMMAILRFLTRSRCARFPISMVIAIVNAGSLPMMGIAFIVLRFLGLRFLQTCLLRMSIQPRHGLRLRDRCR